MTIELRVFGAPNFNARAWLNAQTPPLPDESSSGSSSSSSNTNTSTNMEEPLDSLPTTLLHQLQVLQEQLALELEQRVEQTVAMVPRMLSDLETVKTEVAALGERSLAVRKGIQANANNNNSKSTVSAQLKRLDMVKMRMEEAATTLKEATRWTALQADLEASLATQDYLKAANLLAEARKSLAVLEGTAEFADRARLLESYTVRIESALGEHVVAAFSARNPSAAGASSMALGGGQEAAGRLCEIFVKIGLRERFVEHYTKAMVARVQQQLWTAVLAVPSSTAASDPAGGTMQLELETFLDELYLMLHQESAWNSAVFGGPDPTALGNVQLTVAIFQGLNPTWTAHVRGWASNAGSFASVVKVYHKLEVFWDRMERLFAISTNAATTSHTASMVTHVFEPFSACQKKYGDMERAYLVHQLQLQKYFQLTAHPKHVRPENGYKELQNMLAEAFLVLEGATDRCQLLTHFQATRQLQEGLSGAVLFLVEQLQSRMRGIFSVLFEVVEDHSKKRAAHRKEPSAARLTSTNHAISEDALDFEEEDAATNKLDAWNPFQVAQNLLILVHSLLERIGYLQAMVNKKIAAATQHQQKDAGQDPLLSVKVSGTVLSRIHLGQLLPASVVDKHSSGELVVAEERVEKAVSRLAISSLQLLFQVFFRPVYTIFLTVHRMDSFWSSGNGSRPVAAFHGLELPSFSISPSAYVNEIGELLLALPQRMEMFMNTNDPAGSLLMRLVDTLELAMHLPMETLDGDVPGSVLVALGTRLFHDGSQSSREDADDQNEDPTTVAHRWLAGICSVTLSTFVKQVLRIPKAKMTAFGAQQVLSDLEYLLNVVSALGMDEGGEEDAEESSMSSQEWMAITVLRQTLNVFVKSMEGSLSGRDAALSTFRQVWIWVGSATQALPEDTSEPVRALVLLLRKQETHRPLFVQLLQLLFGPAALDVKK